MTKIEKSMTIIAIIVMISLFGGIWYLNTVIEDAGGIKQMIIDAGKEVKDIRREIDKH